jgi:methanogenic corrinoid protein MtbC1
MAGRIQADDHSRQEVSDVDVTMKAAHARVSCFKFHEVHFSWKEWKLMKNPLEERLASFSPVSREAAEEYERKAPSIAGAVSRRMQAREDFFELIGESPVEAVLENHENHVGTIAEVLESGRYDLMAGTVPWVYRSYLAHGVTSGYFPVLFRVVKTVLEDLLSRQSAGEIVPLYDALLESHEAMMTYSAQEHGGEDPQGKSGELSEEAGSFRDALLSGDHSMCLDMASERVTSGDDLEAFYLEIIQPAMYSIGNLWERGEISVAEEHLASAIVARVMASLYAWVLRSQGCYGKAIVSAAPNEYHEIGARMVADLLERDGWNVEYLGSDMEFRSLLERVKKTKPFLLALSVAMPFNLHQARGVIRDIRRKFPHERIKIMVGGQVFKKLPDFWEAMGADGYASDASDAARLACTWWKEADRRLEHS